MIKIACRACSSLNDVNVEKCEVCGIESPDKAPKLEPVAASQSNWGVNLISLSFVGLVLFGLHSCINRERDSTRVGRNFTSMDQCLEFIRNDTGEELKISKDTPGYIAGMTTPSKLFFVCELKNTGTQGLVLQGRWNRHKK